MLIARLKQSFFQVVTIGLFQKKHRGLGAIRSFAAAAFSYSQLPSSSMFLIIC